MIAQKNEPFEPFLEVKETTLCPFARASSIELGPPWSEGDSYSANVGAIAKALANHLQRAQREQLQGFVAQVAVANGATFAETVTGFSRFLHALAQHDDSASRCLQADVGAVGWNFLFADFPIFLNLFASCYPKVHSKHVPAREPNRYYVFFQPEFTFDFCNVNRTKTSLKDGIRSRFADAGMPYDGGTIDSRRKALSFVFPMNATDGPVSWWTEAFVVHRSGSHGN